MDDIVPAEILRNPSETVQSELKSWLDLGSLEHRAKVARALLALRNRGGGRLVFGFDDKTIKPVAEGRPVDIRVAYHPDKVQAIVKEFALPTFPVSVDFAAYEEKEFPVITVPSGVRFPAIARQNVTSGSDEVLLRQNAVYIRTVNSGRVESTEPKTPQDWNELLELCFDNREADVGRFLRRHLGGILNELGLAPSSGRANADAGTAPMLGELASVPKTPPTIRSPRVILDEGGRRFEARRDYMRKEHAQVVIPDYVAWREVAVVLEGDLRQLAGQHILEAVFPHHPNLSGWPQWIDSRPVSEGAEHPYPHDSGWEALVTMGERGFFNPALVDFWRIDPNGEFYHRRSFEEDSWVRISDDARGTLVDFVQSVTRVAEAFATIQAFARGFVTNPDEAVMHFAFRWTNLSNRKLTSFDGRRAIWSAKPAYDDVILVEIEMPVNAASGAIASYVAKATAPLFGAFGYSLAQKVVEELTAETLSYGSR